MRPAPRSTPPVPSHASPGPGRPGVGPLLREWRSRRRRSQMDLALDAGVSTRHLSCIETGRAQPSPAMLMALAEHLQVPLRERNQLLLAAGYAPRYGEAALDAHDMAPVRAALQRLLDAHDPYPGLVLDRQWNMVLANPAAQALAALLPPALAAPPLNVFRVSLHPQGLAAHTANFAEWAGHLLDSLQRAVQHSADAALLDLQREVLAYPNVQALPDQRVFAAGPPPAPALLVPCVLDLPQGRVSLFTTLTTFGTPRDVTLQELCVELFYPADAASEALLRGTRPDLPTTIGTLPPTRPGAPP